MVNRIDNYFREYLQKRGYFVEVEKPIYIVRNILDVFAILVYYITSIICIFMDKASTIVLILNGICMFRVLLRNMMKSSEMSDYFKEHNNMNVYYQLKNPYMIKLLLQITFFTGTIVGLILSGDLESSQVVKGMSFLAILVVLFDDLECVCIYSYGARVNYLDTKRNKESEKDES